MPQGKPAGVRCAQLSDDHRCRVFGQPSRPAVCGGLLASPEMCGENREHALHWLRMLEASTRPDRQEKRL
jgi:hypothetical protein